MEKITRHNYEAFFLDYLEDELNEEKVTELKIFLLENPDLATELEDYSSVTLKPETTANTWNDLKVPSLESLAKNEWLREQLYFRCADNQANEYDERLLAELLTQEQFNAEYTHWRKLKLHSTNETVDRESLYHLPLLLPITPSNYEDFLIARTEGILSVDENQALEKYAAGIKGGEKDLALAEFLKLEAPQGIFYPFKNDLKKKRNRLVLFYRAAAILLLFGLGASLLTFLNRSGTPDLRYAQRQVVHSSPDSLKESDLPKETREDTIWKGTKSERYELEEWELREPDPAFIADKAQLKNNPKIEPEQPPSLQENLGDLEYAEVESIEQIEQEQIELLAPDVEIRNEDEMILAQEIANNQKIEYQTIGDIAQDRLANQLNLSDTEKDELALSLARLISQKAGEALDSELTKETDQDSESLTYTLRIRGFKVSHTKSK